MCVVSSRIPVFTFASRPGVLFCRVWPSLCVWCAFMSNSGLFPVYFICSRTRLPRLWDVNYGTIPGNSPGFPGSLQVVHKISRSPGKSTKSPGNYLPWLFLHFLSINFVGNVLSHFENFWGCLQVFVLWRLAGMGNSCIWLLPAATEKVGLIRPNIVWNRWKSTLTGRSIRVNMNHWTEM